VILKFDDPILPTTDIILTGADGAAVRGNWTINGAIASFIPTPPFLPNTKYRVTIQPLNQPAYSFTFVTEQG